MHWQSIVALAIVAITLLIFATRLLRPAKKSGGCGHDCGCGKPSRKAGE